ncbi:MAG: DUF86 domain-containing protein [Firmicutes bacterium]|nr:DUF86 domain-containing protein [Bacillota bacterium]
MIDRMMIKQRLSMIADYCQELEQLCELSRVDFLNKINSAAAESFLRRSLEAVFDIGRHILAKTSYIDLTKEYKSIAHGLGTAKIVTQQLSEKMVEMAGYRNRLVHLYHMVSDDELYRTVKSNIPNLLEFVREINLFLNEGA